MDDLKALGAHPIALDVSKEESIMAAVAEIEARFGGVDVLVNNAGFGLYGAIEDVPMAEARYQFEVNLFGLARVTQRLAPHMRRQKSGKIVNISSMGGKVYTPLGGWYHATKHAVEGLSDCPRLELAPFGIDVVVIEPPTKKMLATTRSLGLQMNRFRPLAAHSGESRCPHLRPLRSSLPGPD